MPELAWYGPWREPDVETTGLYPGLVVHDGRQTGSITTGRSRLPVWAFAGVAILHGWAEVESGWEPSQYGWTADKMADFVYYLMEQRGEFGRLLLTLADVERREHEGSEEDWPVPWWSEEKPRNRVLRQLRRCVAALESARKAGFAQGGGTDGA